jgi:hypothetical protein
MVVRMPTRTRTLVPWSLWLITFGCCAAGLVITPDRVQGAVEVPELRIEPLQPHLSALELGAVDKDGSAPRTATQMAALALSRLQA